MSEDTKEAVQTITLPVDTLTRWRTSLTGLLTALRQFQVAKVPEIRRDRFKSAEDAAVLLVNQLEQAGAEKKEGRPRGSGVPLHLLDTPKNRKYAQKLREAWEAGLEVDEERYGPQIGTDGMAQMVEMLLVDTERECYGAMGKD